MVLPDKMTYLVIDREKGLLIPLKKGGNGAKKHRKNVTASQLQLLHALPIQLLSTEKLFVWNSGMKIMSVL